MLVSVIITTKNEEKNIGNCLKSIKAQSYPQDKIEIIVVDNNSTDKTKEIIRSFCHSLRTCHSEQREESPQSETSRIQLSNRGPERSAQRNFGMINVAKGKYVMFVDADMILSPCLVESCVKEMEKDCQSSNLKPPASNEDNSPSNLQPPTSNLQPPTSIQQPVVALHIPEIVLGKNFLVK